MKKLGNMTLVLAVMLWMTVSVQAEEITITFDEAGISIGDDITTQYQELGVVWSDTYENLVAYGPDYNNSFESDGLILNYYSSNGLIDLYAPADTLSFEFRRPNPDQVADIYLELYDTTGDEPLLVYDFGRIGWDGSDWVTFSYDGSYGNFNQIFISGTNKFVMDNLTIHFPVSPVAEAGEDQKVKNGEVVLDGSESGDPDGEIVSYAWSLRSRFAEEEVIEIDGENPTVTGLAKGIYNVTLTVTDDEGLSDTDTMTVTSCFISSLW